MGGGKRSRLSTEPEEFDLALKSLLRASPSRVTGRNRNLQRGAGGREKRSEEKVSTDSRRPAVLPEDASKTDPSLAFEDLGLSSLFDGCLFKPSADSTVAQESVFGLQTQGTAGLPVAGAAELTVLRGSVAVLGYVATSRTGPVRIYSAPLGPFFVTLHAASAASLDKVETPPLCLTERERVAYDALQSLLPTFSNKYAIIRLKGLHDKRSISSVIAPYMSGLALPLAGLSALTSGANPNPLQSIVRGLVHPDATSKLPSFKLWEDWTSVETLICKGLSKGLESCRFLVCGENGSGKSMLARCVVNYILSASSCDALLFVDTDVGQPELTPPGLISAVELRNPLLGPPASHNRHVPVFASFFGETTARENTSLYKESVRNVLAAARSYAADRGLPIVCNTDGWTTGTGADLLKDLTFALEPSCVLGTCFERPPVDGIVKRRRSSKKSEAQVPEVVNSIVSLLGWDCSAFLSSPSESRCNVFPGSLLRELSFVSYFGHELSDGLVHNVHLEDVNIAFLGEGVPPQHLLAALNGSLVGLAETNGLTSAHVWNVRGLGIIRAVQSALRLLHVVTPLPIATLEGCDGIVMCSGIQLPPCMYLSGGSSITGPNLPQHGLPCGEFTRPYVVSSSLSNSDSMRSRTTLCRR